MKEVAQYFSWLSYHKGSESKHKHYCMQKQEQCIRRNVGGIMRTWWLHDKISAKLSFSVRVTHSFTVGAISSTINVQVHLMSYPDVIWANLSLRSLQPTLSWEVFAYEQKWSQWDYSSAWTEVNETTWGLEKVYHLYSGCVVLHFAFGMNGPASEIRYCSRMAESCPQWVNP